MFRVSVPLVSSAIALSGCCCFSFGDSGAGSESEGERSSAATAAVTTRPTVEGGVPIEALRVRVPRTKPDGRHWDVGRGAPDLVVRVRQDGFLVLETDVARDQYETTFQVTSPAQIHPARPVEIEVLDRDAASDDAIGTVTLEPGERSAVLPHGAFVSLQLDDPVSRARRELVARLRPGQSYGDPAEPMGGIAARFLHFYDGVVSVAARRLEGPPRVVMLVRVEEDYADPGSMICNWVEDLRRHVPDSDDILVAALQGDFAAACSLPAGAPTNATSETYNAAARRAIDTALAPSDP